jgi:hypothetical protein
MEEGVGLRLRDGEVWEWSGDADPISTPDAQPCVLLAVACRFVSGGGADGGGDQRVAGDWGFGAGDAGAAGGVAVRVPQAARQPTYVAHDDDDDDRYKKKRKSSLLGELFDF